VLEINMWRSMAEYSSPTWTRRTGEEERRRRGRWRLRWMDGLPGMKEEEERGASPSLSLSLSDGG